MSRIAFALSLVVLSGVTQISQEAPSQEAAAYNDPDAYEVYSAILPQEWPWRVAKAQALAIRTETEPYKMCGHPDSESDRPQQPLVAAIADYEKENQKEWLLQKQFEISKPYELVSKEEITTAFNEGVGLGWRTFNTRHPDSHGWVELSAVGFDSSKTVAIVYVGHHCGGLCGGGTFHVLQKIDGKWMPVKWGSFCMWVS